eukprot:TRINITY_DN4040_c0_g1_i1.p1 TRINITY_DN4040_c0_g1~~TRINITY_DN4040_c0_g1_i1.p1  ORF type:complete len:322 (-),score=76.76 TRINITY_DN4040_c0_g1_i1:206-1147(-)
MSDSKAAWTPTANPGRAVVGVIGGTGLYKLEGFDAKEVNVTTPYGDVNVKLGDLHGMPVAFVPRHGAGHSVLPAEVNYRGNIHALKQLGVKFVIAISACGSLREEMKPGDLVIVDQLIDRTVGRPSTFFGDGLVAHVSLGDPVCKPLHDIVFNSAKAIHADKKEVTIHPSGTYICIQGPSFSTRPESNMYRQWGADVIGMTGMPEARLAREAELSYAMIACITDYDAWRPHEESVTAAAVIKVLATNAVNAQAVLPPVFAALNEAPPVSPAHSALECAIVTDLMKAPAETVAKLQPLLQTHLDRARAAVASPQ